ncbi:RNA polymerase I associated factor, A49-like protein, partial [Catenaria anguillulae PL171]
MKRKFTLESDPSPDGSIGPVLATLGGVVGSDDQSFSVYRHAHFKTPAKSSLRVVTGDSPTIQLYGDSFSEPSGTEGIATYAVGIIDKVRGKVRVVAAPVVHLEPKYKLVAKTNAERVDKSSMMAARNALGTTFGNKRAKTAIKALERGRINADALDKAAGELHASVEHSLEFVPTSEELALELELDNPLPPHDLQATDVTQVYPLDGLFPQRAQGALMKIVAKVRSAKDLLEQLGVDADNEAGIWLEREIVSLLVKRTGSAAAKTKAGNAKPVPKQDQSRAALCLYALYLVRMTKCRDSNLKGNSALVASIACPDVLAWDLLNGYTDRVPMAGTKVKHALTPRAKTRLLCHVLACYLHLHSFSLSVQDVAKDLGANISQVQELLRAMGCNGTSLSAAEKAELGLSAFDKSTTRYSLSAPLKLPGPRIAKKGGSRR